MGCRELIDALYTEGEEKVNRIWKEAEAEAQKISDETFKRIEELREKYSVILSSYIKEQIEPILSEAANRARTIRLLAEREFSDRLYSIALQCLYLLRDERYKDIFAALVNELPPNKWRTVRVNPEDKGIAKEYFPNSEVIPDSNITGGVYVIGGDGRVNILNIFEKRLERAWAEILPGLMRDVYSEAAIIKEGEK